MVALRAAQHLCSPAIPSPRYRVSVSTWKTFHFIQSKALLHCAAAVFTSAKATSVENHSTRSYAHTRPALHIVHPANRQIDSPIPNSSACSVFVHSWPTSDPCRARRRYPTLRSAKQLRGRLSRKTNMFAISISVATACLVSFTVPYLVETGLCQLGRKGRIQTRHSTSKHPLPHQRSSPRGRTSVPLALLLP